MVVVNVVIAVCSNDLTALNALVLQPDLVVDNNHDEHRHGVVLMQQQLGQCCPAQQYRMQLCALHRVPRARGTALCTIGHATRCSRWSKGWINSKWNQFDNETARPVSRVPRVGIRFPGLILRVLKDSSCCTLTFANSRRRVSVAASIWLLCLMISASIQLS